MESRAKLFGHSVHQMLIVFPLGLLATAAGFDIVYLSTGNGRWADIAYWMITVGVVAGLIAAVFGFIDWGKIPKGTRARRTGVLHGFGNVIVIILFAVNWGLRHDVPTMPPTAAPILSIIAALLATGTAWLGGELVDRLGIGIDDGANVDAPSSLSGRPATVPRPL